MESLTFDLRLKRQKQFAETFTLREKGDLFGYDGGGILYLCPRFGKCAVGLYAIQNEFSEEEILISYPDNKIKKSWEDECERLDYFPNITYTNHMSLKKYVDRPWGLVILDEIHSLSEAQIDEAKKIKAPILGLTGTMTSWTEKDLKRELGLSVLARYPIEKAIEEGVLADYEIRIVQVPLDNRVPQTLGKKVRTEQKHYDAYTWVIGKIEKENEDLDIHQKKDTKFLRMTRMRIIQNSLAKLNQTKELLKSFENERVLVFCGVTKIADRIGCPVYHSKAGEKQVFDDFCEGKGNHLAVVRIGFSGVTYKPLNKVIINYFDSNAENMAQKINRCMAMEYDNPEKKAIIYIICSGEVAEVKWLMSALEFFDKSKIK